MPRGLDHVVHAVADLDAAADFYRRCGFQVGARNRHPWGTHNHVVQMPGFFIEILTVAEPEKLGDDGLSQHFGKFQQKAITQGDGFSMLVVESGDIVADVAEFADHGIGTSQALPFERQATMPDGSSATVGFSLAFAHDPKAPRAGFAACRQHNPGAFWKPDYQTHRNGAKAIAGVVLVAPRPADHVEFLKAFAGLDDVEERVAGALLRTPRGEIEVLELHAFEERYDLMCKAGSGLSIAALRIGVERLDDVESELRNGDVALQRAGALLCVPAQAAFGATLIFEQPHIA